MSMPTLTPAAPAASKSKGRLGLGVCHVVPSMEQFEEVMKRSMNNTKMLYEMFIFMYNQFLIIGEEIERKSVLEIPAVLADFYNNYDAGVGAGEVGTDTTESENSAAAGASSEVRTEGENDNGNGAGDNKKDEVQLQEQAVPNPSELVDVVMDEEVEIDRDTLAGMSTNVVRLYNVGDDDVEPGSSGFQSVGVGEPLSPLSISPFVNHDYADDDTESIYSNRTEPVDSSTVRIEASVRKSQRLRARRIQSPTPPSNHIPSTPTPIMKKGPAQCPHCSKIIEIGRNGAGNYNKHLATHERMFQIKQATVARAPKTKRVKCAICNHEVNRNVFQRHLRTHAKNRVKSFVCPECDKRFLYLSSMKRHLATHNVQFKCQYCNAGFRGLNERYEHILKRHQNETN